MKRIAAPAAAALLALAAACSDATSPEGTSLDVDPAFTSVPTGFGDVLSSFAGSDSSAWTPTGHHRRHRRGHGGPPRGWLMGGGLGSLFMGEGLGLHHGGRPFG